jgi:hypothetical protein
MKTNSHFAAAFDGVTLATMVYLERCRQWSQTTAIGRAVSLACFRLFAPTRLRRGRQFCCVASQL